MIVANKEAYKLSEQTGCSFSECKSALIFCKDCLVAFYYLKLTGEAVVRYKKDFDKIVNLINFNNICNCGQIGKAFDF